MPRWQTPFNWKYPLREIRRRPGRSLLTLAGIVLGVAAVAAVNLAIEVTRESYEGMFQPLVGRTDLEVVPTSGPGTFRVQLEEVQRLAGVRAVAPIVQIPAGLRTNSQTQSLFILGVDPLRDSAIRDYHLLAGADLSGDRGVLLEKGFASRHGIAVGGSARLVTARGLVEVEVTGLVAALGPARFNGGAIAFIPLEQARSLFGIPPGEVTALHVGLDPGADRQAVRQAIEAKLPGVMAQAPQVKNQLAGAFLVSIEQMLRSLSAIAVVAGGLVILNTFLMSLGERHRQLALLRALGATRGQITALLLRQALLLGGFGTLLGLPLGILLAMGLLAINEAYLGVPLARFDWPVGPIILAGVLGLAMTILATVYPARQAAQRPPLAGLQTRAVSSVERFAWWPIVLGTGLLIGVLTFELSIVRGWLVGSSATPFLPLMVGSALIGCACVLPALLPVLLRAVAWVVPLFLGAEGRLAVRQLMRQRARTGLTVGVLFAALTACLSFGTSFLNNLRDIDVWFAQTIDTPYLVRAVQPDPAVIVTPAPLPAFAVEEIRRLPGCASALKVSFHATRIQEQAALILAREFSADTPLPLSLHAGEPADVLAALARGETVVGSALAARLRVGVGDSITLPGRHGPHRVRIGGIAKEYTVGGMALYLDWEQASRLVGIEHPHALAVTPRPGEEEAFESALTGYCARQGLLLQHNIDFAALIYRVVRGVRVLVVGMVALIFLVAGLGVINTLTTNILDQTRELGILRALGMKRQQLGKLILAQALVLAVVSCLSGTPAGVLLSYLMNLATPGLLGHHVPFRIHTWYVIVCVLGLSVLAVLAALVPARRAARLAVIDALRYE